MAGALADPAVGHDGVTLLEAKAAVAVDRLEVAAGAEPSVLGNRARPWNVLRRRDVTSAQCPLLGVVGHVNALAGVLLG